MSLPATPRRRSTARIRPAHGVGQGAGGETERGEGRDQGCSEGFMRASSFYAVNLSIFYMKSRCREVRKEWKPSNQAALLTRHCSKRLKLPFIHSLIHSSNI